MTSTIFSGGVIRTVIGTTPDWVMISDGLIAGVGSDADRPDADREVDLEGAALVPAFCDAHVHLPATGLYARGMDFRGEHSSRKILDAYEAKAREAGAILFGGNFEDPLDEPLTAADLDDSVGRRPALLARADMHSCIASSALLDELDLHGVAGVDRDENGAPTGYLREHAAAQAWRWFDANLSAAQQRAAIEAAAQLAYSKGVSSVHEMFVLEWRGWSSLEVFLEAAQSVTLDVKTYVATPEVNKIKELGLDCVGGDLFLDGSFGTHTAWLRDPYESQAPTGSDPNGTSYRSDAELTAFFSEAQDLGMQTGVHAIGDAAIEQAIRCWERVADHGGIEHVRALGHRIEHFECATSDHIERAAKLGLRASIQPAFDAYWGGAQGLYSQRIGTKRAAEMNRFSTMEDKGLVVGAGSDSTVTPLDPFLQMAALRAHHQSDERMDAERALRIHTLGSHALAGRETVTGSIEAGKRADLAIIDRDPITVDPDELVKTTALGTWIEGTRVWPGDEAEGV